MIRQSVNASANSRPHSAEPTPSSRFTTRLQAGIHRGGSKRFLWAGLAAIIGLALLIIFGPSESTIQHKFEYYGAPGELQIMPQISIDDGADKTHQLPKTLQQPPPPAQMQIEKEETSETGTVDVPKVNPESETKVDEYSEAAVDVSEEATEEQVKLSLPTQSSPDWYILHQVRPVYPLEISDTERHIPVIYVNVAVFVDATGKVTASMVTGTNGSKPFSLEVISKVDQWIFGWRVAPGAGRWIEMTWNFHSPYFKSEFRQAN